MGEEKGEAGGRPCECRLKGRKKSEATEEGNKKTRKSE
jgi:hypothetical protein